MPTTRTRSSHPSSTTTTTIVPSSTPRPLRSDRSHDASRRRQSRPRPRPRPGPRARLPGQPHLLHHHRLLLPGLALERRPQLRRGGRREGRALPPPAPAAAARARREDVHVARERRQRHQEGPRPHRLRRLPGRTRRQRRGRRRRGRRRRPQEAQALQGPGRRPRGVLQDAQHAQPQAEDGAGEPAGPAATAGGGVVPEPPGPYQAQADGGGLRVHEALVRAARGAEQATREGGRRAQGAQGSAILLHGTAGLPRRHAHHVPIMPPRRHQHHRQRLCHAAATAAMPPQIDPPAGRERPAQPLPVLPVVQRRRRRPVRQAGHVERRRAAARHQRTLLMRS